MSLPPSPIQTTVRDFTTVVMTHPGALSNVLYALQSGPLLIYARFPTVPWALADRDLRL